MVQKKLPNLEFCLPLLFSQLCINARETVVFGRKLLRFLVDKALHQI